MNISYGTYQTIFAAHQVALENNWIARMGYDNGRNLFWIEYVGVCAP